MKRILILLTMMVFVLVMASCETKKIEKNDETIDEDVIEVDTETDNDSVTETDDDQVVPDEDVCALNQDWLAPASEWEAWGYLRMSGEIGDYNGDYVEATFTEGKMKIASGTTDLGLGSFMNYQGTTLLADAVAYEFISQTASLATVDYYDAMWQFSSQLVPLFKEDGVREADFAAFVWFRNSFIDLVIQNQEITEQRTRKSCWLALAATEEVEEEGETYDVPVGGIYGCFDDNVDGSVGETLKMMFRNKMTDNRDDILTFINTLEDNTVLEYGDEGFRFECECYNENGATATVGENEVPCWQYDGPGGAEECPAEVEAAGKCGEGAPDEDIVDEDVVDEENPDADGISSKMVPCDQTGVTAPANAAIVVADVEVTWTGEGWTAPAKCVWACNTDYDKEGETCINSKLVDCLANAGKPANSSDVTVQHTITYTTAVGWTTAPVCDWACDADYDKEGETCINTKNVPCDQTGVTAPANAAIVVADVEVTFTTAAGWTDAAKCGWACDADYDKEGETCVNSKMVDCVTNTEKPANSSDVVIQHTVTFTTAGGWETAPVCDWACNTDYYQEGETCINSKTVDCLTNTGKPVNSSDVVVQHMINYTTLDGWEPAPVCNWTCNTDYYEESGSCINTREVDCLANTEKPANSSDVVVKHTINYTTDDGWEETPVCEWACDNCFMLTVSGEECEVQPVVFVDINASGDGTGWNWADAKTDLSDAIDNACEGQDIWVAQGIYHPATCPNRPTCNLREEHFTMKNNVGIYGGFNGTETLLTERNVELYETILSGDFYEDDGEWEEELVWDEELEEDILMGRFINSEENAMNVFYHPDDLGLDGSGILDGFTVTGGNADEHISLYYGYNGGGIYNGIGNGMKIDNCYFYRNHGYAGGAIYNGFEEEDFSITQMSDVFVDNSIFEENHSDSSGNFGSFGANFIQVTNSIFANNFSSKGGAGIDFSGNEIIVKDSVFSNNTNFDGTGGAIRAKSMNFILENTSFTNNTSNTAGALMQMGNYLNMSNCLFDGNEAFIFNSDADMAGLAGAVVVISMNPETGDPVEGFAGGKIINTVFKNNYAGMIGGAIAFFMGSVEISNSTFDGNSSAISPNGIAYLMSSVSFANSIITDQMLNVTDTSVIDPESTDVFPPSTVEFYNSDVIGCGGSAMTCGVGGDESCWITACGTDGLGNIDTDPMFVGAGDDPLMLAAGSPCINAGNNDYVPVGVTADVLGNNRIIGGIVDMGAYESSFIPAGPCDSDPCDSNTNGQTVCVPDSGTYFCDCEAGYVYDDVEDLCVLPNETIIHYYTGWATPYIHYNNGIEWTEVPGELMTTDGTWAEITVSWTMLVKKPSGFEFAFNDGGSNWDNPSGGGNYNAFEPEIWVKDGVVYKYDPENPPKCDLSGWKITQTDAARTHTFPADTFIPAGGILVLGRNSTKEAFQIFWNVTFNSDVVYINSSDNMPQINGDETYSLSDSSNLLIDGPSPKFPAGGAKMVSRASYGIWNGMIDFNVSNATPGTVNHTPSNEGFAYMTEIADATGSGNFVYEFIEIYCDITL